MRASVLSVVLVAACLAPRAARADASGWAALGGGALGWQAGDEGELVASPTMTIDMGVGTTPEADFIFGGLFRVMPVFTEGADIALMARFCPSGFQSDVISFAVDAGGYARFWGTESAGFV